MEKIFIAPQPLKHSTGNNQSPPSLSTGMGHIQWIRLKSGIQLFTMDYTPHQPLAVEFASPFTSLAFYFSLTGHSRVHAGERKINVLPGKATFSCYSNPSTAGITETFGAERFVRVGIFMEGERFKTYAEKQMNSLTMQMNNSSAEMLNYEDRVTTAMCGAISQILNCPYQGAARSFFLESKILELVAHKIGQFQAVDTRALNVRPLLSSDADRVREAGRILTRDLENPPDLNQLARSVGLSQRSLYRYFHKIHGMPPFDYLRNHRLKTAMELMRSKEANVTEAAFLVGYSNLSYFAKAFKSKFGITPSQCLKQSVPYSLNAESKP